MPIAQCCHNKSTAIGAKSAAKVTVKRPAAPAYGFTGMLVADAGATEMLLHTDEAAGMLEVDVAASGASAHDDAAADLLAVEVGATGASAHDDAAAALLAVDVGATGASAQDELTTVPLVELPAGMAPVG